MLFLQLPLQLALPLESPGLSLRQSVVNGWMTPTSCSSSVVRKALWIGRPRRPLGRRRPLEEKKTFYYSRRFDPICYLFISPCQKVGERRQSFETEATFLTFILFELSPDFQALERTAKAGGQRGSPLLAVGSGRSLFKRKLQTFTAMRDLNPVFCLLVQFCRFFELFGASRPLRRRLVFPAPQRPPSKRSGTGCWTQQASHKSLLAFRP